MEPATVELDPLLTSDELRLRLKVSIETVRWWRKQGKGPRALKVGRHVRYRESDIEAWLARNTDPVSA